MPVKYIVLVFCMPVILACNIQFEIPKSVPEPTEEVSTDNDSKTPNPAASWENDLLDMVNDLRKSGCRCGNKSMKPVAPLALHTDLNKIAQTHADDMYINRFFSHTGSDGSQVSDRATKVGFNWSNIGENISQGYPTVESAFNGWKNSSGHCKNMMSPDFKLMGAAQKGSYWVQTFGNAR